MAKIKNLLPPNTPFLFALVLIASSAKAVVETQVEAGEAQIYQSVETGIVWLL